MFSHALCLAPHRYYRYQESVGKGRFKEVFKAFNSQMGIDCAWSKVCIDQFHLTPEQKNGVINDMEQLYDLDHPNVSQPRHTACAGGSAQPSRPLRQSRQGPCRSHADAGRPIRRA